MKEKQTVMAVPNSYWIRNANEKNCYIRRAEMLGKKQTENERTSPRYNIETSRSEAEKRGGLMDGGNDINNPISLPILLKWTKRAFALLKDDKKTILRTTAIAACAGLFIALGSGEEYQATMKLLPYKNGNSQMGGISSLAGIAGVRLPQNVNDQIIPVDLYPEVARSFDFKRSLAETKVAFSGNTKGFTFIEYFRSQHNKSPVEILRSLTVGIPRKIAFQIRRTADSIKPHRTSHVPKDLPIPAYTTEYIELINSLDNRLEVNGDKKTSIITIKGRMPDRYAAADLVRIASDKLKETVAEYESRKSTEQFNFIYRQHETAKERLEIAQRRLAEYTDRNRMIGNAVGQIEGERLKRQYDITYEIYQQLSRELEQARIKKNQDTPVFVSIQSVSVPPNRISPQRAKIVLISVALGIALSLSRALIKPIFRNVKDEWRMA